MAKATISDPRPDIDPLSPGSSALLNDDISLKIKDGWPETCFHAELSQQLPSFRSYHAALGCLDKERNYMMAMDCKNARTANPKESTEAYSSGSTFFLPCQMRPRCLLEQLASDIWNRCTEEVYRLDEGKDNNASERESSRKKQRIDAENDLNSEMNDTFLFDPRRSGVEWWTLVLDADDDSADSRSYEEESNDENEYNEGESACDADDIGFHFDADYGLEDSLGLIHPHFSTITYLSDVGVPTIILEKRSCQPSALGGPIKSGYVSYPRVGKQVIFDGRFLHGAASAFFPPKKMEVRGERITFLANVWFNHCPVDADILPEELLVKMSPPVKNFSTRNEVPDDLLTLSIPSAEKVLDSKKQRIRKESVETVICSRNVSMILETDFNRLEEAPKFASSCDTLRVTFEGSSLILNVSETTVESDAADDQMNREIEKIDG